MSCTGVTRTSGNNRGDQGGDEDSGDAGVSVEESMRVGSLML